MLFDRQRQLLILLSALGGRARNLEFQKLLFLFCEESDAGPAYEFVPYRFGAFSLTSYADRRKLIDRDLLVDDEQIWALTHKGKEHVAKITPVDGHRIDAVSFAQRHSKLRGDALIAETYRRYPYYATRSEVAGRVLQGDRKMLRKISESRPKTGPAGIATIGYEGRTLEGYLNVLIRSGVTLLCDVRRNPISRKFGFSKKTLTQGCTVVGIKYEHLPELGIASEQRKTLETQSDYDRLFANYEAYTLPQQNAALQKIYCWVTAGERVALTCFERLPHQCHRHCVADALSAEFGIKFMPVHL